MVIIALIFVVLPLVIGIYAYIVYPVLVYLFSRTRPDWQLPPEPEVWPTITITVPVYNEAHVIRQRIENLLALDYPADRRHILVLSDASTDGTDDIVREFSDRGVELHRVEVRAGKSAAENAAARYVRGDIVVNVDATTRIFPQSLRALIRAFADPAVGVASGRIVSERVTKAEATDGESRYVGYEMSLRRIETRLASIVGASGCFYGIRRHLFDGGFPLNLSRDFASALVANENGYRAVSVDEAPCGVPVVPSLAAEYRRKVRTMHRGLATLWHKRALLNPFKYGRFSFMLVSHKLCRWLVYPALLPAIIALLFLPFVSTWAVVLPLVAAVLLIIGWRVAFRSTDLHPSKLNHLIGYVVASNLAGLSAWRIAMFGSNEGIWEPTRRTV